MIQIQNIKKSILSLGIKDFILPLLVGILLVYVTNWINRGSTNPNISITNESEEELDNNRSKLTLLTTVNGAQIFVDDKFKGYTSKDTATNIAFSESTDSTIIELKHKKM